MSKVVKPDFPSRGFANRLADGVVIHAEGKFLKRPSRPLNDGDVSRAPGLGLCQANHVVADVVWFQVKKLAASHARKCRHVAGSSVRPVLDVPKQRT
jgi:hypothetical protein